MIRTRGSPRWCSRRDGAGDRQWSGRGREGTVLPSFPWRASTSVHDGRRALFSRVHVQPVHGVRVRVRVRGVCHVRGFAQFSMARVNFRPRRPSASFFPCPRTARSRVRVRVRLRGVCHVRGFAQFSMARVNFRPRRLSASFFPCPRTARSRLPLSVFAW